MAAAALVAPAAGGCSGRARDAGPASVPSGDEPAAGGAAQPARPPRPLDAARLEALAGVAVAGRDVTVTRRGSLDLAATVTGAGAGDRVTVTISACLACVPMELSAWQARRPELAAIWAPRGDDGDRLELRTMEVSGADGALTAIAIESTRALDGASHQTYQLHWNDGATQVAVVCEAAGPPDAGRPPCQATADAALAAFLAAL